MNVGKESRMQYLEQGNYPEISVIIPVYNREKALGRCVESLLVQINDRIEIIIVDDGSVDNTRQILSRYAKDSHIEVAYMEHGGVSKARNYGLAIATGKYVSFIDSDDFVGNDYIGILLDCAQSDCDIVVFDAWHKINKKGNMFDERKGINVRGEYHASVLYPYLIEQKLNSVWGKIFRRSIVEMYKIRFDESMLISEDFMFVMEYLEKCKTAKICEKIPYYYEHNPNGTWRVKPQHMKDIIRSYDRTYKFINDNMVVRKDSIWNLQLMHCGFLRHICSIIVGLYDSGNLTEDSIKNMMNSKLYYGVINEKYQERKYRIMSYLLKGWHWRYLSLIFKMKGIN